jgi:hypothetical protein
MAYDGSSRHIGAAKRVDERFLTVTLESCQSDELAGVYP